MHERIPPMLQQVLLRLSQSPLPILAGGTDFFPALGDAPVPARLLDISRIDELRGIRQSAAGWRIGAATTWRDVLRAPLPPAFDGLKAAAREVGSVQIQNAGTVGGNLCNASPAADGVPALLALDARVELASVRGTRRLALAEFITGVRSTQLASDELLTAVIVPRIGTAAWGRFMKLGARRYLVISIVMASVVLVPDQHGRLADFRVAVGACSPVAQRLRTLESLLIGRQLQPGLAALVRSEYMPEIAPIDDVRGSARYRRDVAVEVIRRLLHDGMQAKLQRRPDGDSSAVSEGAPV